MHKQVIIFIVLLTSMLHVNAQWGNPCIDENRVDPFFQCNDQSFMPVCGCDHRTYRNECVAFRNAGVNIIDYSGVCIEDYLFHAIYANTVTAELNLYIQFYKSGSANVQIRDAFGKLMLNNNYLTIDRRQFTFYVSDYKPGMYFVFVSSGGSYSYEKFVKL